LMDVDGIYEKEGDASSLIREMHLGQLRSFSSSEPEVDVTGGLTLKVKEASRIAHIGVDVLFINGLKPERVFKALKGERTVGTLIRGVKCGKPH